jgi:hypothetical protein
MAAFVALSALLIQRGSAESKDREEDSPKKRKGEQPRRLRSPVTVNKGGLSLTLYSHSLSLTLAGLFLISFVLHAIGGTAAHNRDALEHGQATLTVWQFLGTSAFWFQSLQNWQSEFLAVGALVVLSIFLRERGSPQSKPVGSKRAETSA